jgi:transcriptional regulator with XRE-family HTH domain
MNSATSIMSKKQKTALGLNIAKMRGYAGLSQAELAEKLEVGMRTVAAWEGGERIPKTNVLEQIARICHQTAPEGSNLDDLVRTPNHMGGWDISVPVAPSGAESLPDPLTGEQKAKITIKLRK